MAKKKPTTRRSVQPSPAATAAGYAAFFVALWFLWDTGFVAPVKLFVVFLHEISHGVAAVATGGRIDRIVLTSNEGGACYCGGGSAFLTLTAGYLGSLAWGLLFLELARFERQSRWTLAIVGVGAAAIAVLFVRSAFGFFFGVGFGVALVFAATRLPTRWNARILTGLGITSALYAILDIKSDVLDRPGLESDAHMLGQLTGVPGPIWGVLWIGLALGVVALFLRRVVRRHRSR